MHFFIFFVICISVRFHNKCTYGIPWKWHNKLSPCWNVDPRLKDSYKWTNSIAPKVFNATGCKIWLLVRALYLDFFLRSSHWEYPRGSCTETCRFESQSASVLKPVTYVSRQWFSAYPKNRWQAVWYFAIQFVRPTGCLVTKTPA